MLVKSNEHNFQMLEYHKHEKHHESLPYWKFCLHFPDNKSMNLCQVNQALDLE